MSLSPRAQRELEEYKRAIDAYIQRTRGVSADDLTRLKHHEYALLYVAGVSPAKVGQGIIDGSFKQKDDDK